MLPTGLGQVKKTGGREQKEKEPAGSLSFPARGAAQSPEAAQDEHEDLDPAWLHEGESDLFDPDFSFFRA